MFLAVRDAGGVVGRKPRLGGTPRRRARLELGEVTCRARYDERDSLLLIAAERPVSAAPGMRCALSGEAIRIVVVLDSLDPSRRAHLARRLGGTRFRDPAELVAAARDALNGITARATETLSPAARGLRAQLAARAHDGANLAALKRDGLLDVADELEREGALLRLEHGHVVERRVYDRLTQWVRERGGDFSAKEIAAEWECSHGRARAILSRMAADGVLGRAGGRYETASSEDAVNDSPE
jgi:hypothetical protein